MAFKLFNDKEKKAYGVARAAESKAVPMKNTIVIAAYGAKYISSRRPDPVACARKMEANSSPLI